MWAAEVAVAGRPTRNTNKGSGECESVFLLYATSYRGKTVQRNYVSSQGHFPNSNAFSWGIHGNLKGADRKRRYGDSSNNDRGENVQESSYSLPDSRRDADNDSLEQVWVQNRVLDFWVLLVYLSNNFS